MSQEWKPISLDTDVPVNIVVPEEAAKSRDAVLDEASELRMLVLGPLGIPQISGGSVRMVLCSVCGANAKFSENYSTITCSASRQFIALTLLPRYLLTKKLHMRIYREPAG